MGEDFPNLPQGARPGEEVVVNGDLDLPGNEKGGLQEHIEGVVDDARVEEGAERPRVWWTTPSIVFSTGTTP
jgi:hypothetical protein